MCNEKILVVGGGLAGISLSYFLSKKGFNIYLVESNNYLGGFYIHDFYKDQQQTGNELVSKYLSYIIDKSDIHRLLLTTGARISDKNYMIKPGDLIPWDDLAIAATGFRCRTLAELGIYGNRPARVYCVNTVMEMLRDGYIPGESPIIYGLNRYTVSLVNSLIKVRNISSITMIYSSSGSIPDNFLRFIERNEVKYLKGKVIWLDSYERVSKIKLDDGRVIEGDSFIIGIITPFNHLNLNYSAGNASIIITDPWKIIELSKLIAENIIEICHGSSIVELSTDLPVSPRFVSRNVRRVMIGYRKGARIVVNNELISLKEDYDIIELPDSEEVTIKVDGRPIST